MKLLTHDNLTKMNSINSKWYLHTCFYTEAIYKDKPASWLSIISKGCGLKTRTRHNDGQANSLFKAFTRTWKDNYAPLFNITPSRKSLILISRIYKAVVKKTGRILPHSTLPIKNRQMLSICSREGDIMTQTEVIHVEGWYTWEATDGVNRTCQQQGWWITLLMAVVSVCWPGALPEMLQFR